jgi:threonine dehydrogenase-like Zn-dependent dehydrogenase
MGPGAVIPALEMYRSLPRYAAARGLGSRFPGVLAGGVAPLRLVRREPPALPGPGWAPVRPLLSGICGSDLATLSGRSSLYFGALVSLPFVPGHEVVGELLADCGQHPAGTRVVLDPLLSCAARGLAPCESCRTGVSQRCDGITGGHVSPGLQTGYCADTGGGWSARLVAHESQLHAVPDGLPDERAVLTEPIACALHVAERADPGDGATVLVVGAGVVGLLTVLALRRTTRADRILAVAKYPRQVELARRFGATDVLSPRDVLGGVRRATSAFRLCPPHASPFLLGGVDVAVDAAGTRDSLDTALRATRAGGRVVLAGMPASGADLSPAWFRELDVRGAYAGGPAPGGVAPFPAALEVAASEGLGDLVSAAYPLARWREAIDHALSAGRLGAAKVALRPTEIGSRPPEDMRVTAGVAAAPTSSGTEESEGW